MVREIPSCRLCGNTDLIPLLDLGSMVMTGFFPSPLDQKIAYGPLELVRCHRTDQTTCGLVQLKHFFAPELLFGDNYGYRSGLNPSMVAHLHDLVNRIQEKVSLGPGDVVVDIGSNDGSLLSAYPLNVVEAIGVDPLAEKFLEYYPQRVRCVPDFFSGEKILETLQGRKARIVTAISVVYDLNDPMRFFTQVADLLEDQGLCVVEMNYLPAMMKRSAFDNICHEHAGYYGISQMQWAADRSGLRMVDVVLNEMNGGSFVVFLVKKRSQYPSASPLMESLMEKEWDLYKNQLCFADFNADIQKKSQKLVETIRNLRSQGKVVRGYGASTRGNVLLQYCHLGPQDLDCVVEVNPQKYGCMTPGTGIPIVSEKETQEYPDYYLMLPWHYKDFILGKNQEFLSQGGHFLIPLPELQII